VGDDAVTHRIRVDIADLATSDDPTAELITHAIGSCIALTLFDPVRRAGGMIHYMLPLSNTSPAKAEANPAMFGDLAIPALFRSMYELGCRKQDLVVKVVGGGNLNADRSLFDIGRRNYIVLRKIFWKNGILIDAEQVGGSVSRTVRLVLATGQTFVRSNGVEVEL